MFAMILIFAIVWLISPIILLILYINEREERKNLELRLRQLENPYVAVPAPFQHQQKSEASPYNIPNTAAAVSMAAKPGRATGSSPYNLPPLPAVGPKKQAEANSAVQPVKQYTSAPPKRKISTINIMLILGALLIIISGLIFATTAWKFLASGVRAIVILSFSAIFFAASSLAERKLKLEKTGILFYTLGSVFLPITMIAAGYFKVFGEYFSLFGEGRPLLLALTFVLLSAVCLKGGCDYANKAFSWSGLLSISAAICCVTAFFTDSAPIFALAAAVYSLAVILLSIFFGKKTSVRFGTILSQLNTFAAVNTVLLSMSSLAAAFSDDGKALTFVSCIIFAGGYLKSCFTEKNAFAGAVPFSIFAAFGLFTLIAPDEFDGIVCTFALFSAIPAVLSFMGILPEKLRGAFNKLSGALSIVSLIMCGISVFVSEPTLISLGAFALLTAEILILAISHRDETGGKLMLGFFPAACVFLCIFTSRLAFKNYPGSVLYIVLMTAALIAALQAAFIAIKPLKLRTLSSDIIFAVSAAVINIILAVSDVCSGWISLAGIAVISGTVLLPCFKSLNKEEEIILPAVSVINFAAASDVIADMLSGIESSHNFARLITLGTITVIICAALAVSRKLEKAVAVNSAAVGAITVSCIYSIIGIDSALISPFIFITGGLFILRSFFRKNIHGFGAGLAACFIGTSFLYIDIFQPDRITYFPFFICGAAAVAYVISLFLPKDSSSYVVRAEQVSRWTLISVNFITLIVLTASHELMPVYLIMTGLFLLLSITAAYLSENTWPMIFSLSAAYFAAGSIIKRGFGTENEHYMTAVYVTVAAMILISIGFSFILHRNALWERRGKLLYLDSFAASRIIGLIMFYDITSGTDAHWWTALLTAAVILSMIRRDQKPQLQKVFIAAAAFMPVTAWITQPFVEIPEIIKLELNILPVLIYCFAIRFIWRNNRNIIDIITFIVYAFSYLILFVDAIQSGELADGLIIVITAMAILIFSFIVKQRKWFILGLTVILTSVIFMSRSFWESLAWWIYLLAAGIILIAIGAANELKKQSASKENKTEFEKKLTRFMSEWTW